VTSAETIEVEDLEGWLDAAHHHGIRAAAIQRVSEIRPTAGEGHAVTVGPTAWVTLIGYRAGALVRGRLSAAPRDLRARLEAMGFQVREVSANIT